jgi:gluconokinase
VVIVLMGPTGAGKTTIGRSLATELGWHFLDADDLHPSQSIAKMRAGFPLDERDRGRWIARVHAAIARAIDRREHTVVACSAPKTRYRHALRGGLRSVRFVYLRADAELLRRRLVTRDEHSASPRLAAGQLADLEEPGEDEAVMLDAGAAPERILGRIRQALGV